MPESIQSATPVALGEAISGALASLESILRTEELSQLTQSGRQGFGLNTTNRCRVVIFGGGIPIAVDGAVIGAVGASGGSVEQDILVANAALAGMKSP